MLYNGFPITDTPAQQLIKNEKTSPYATYSIDDN